MQHTIFAALLGLAAALVACRAGQATSQVTVAATALTGRLSSTQPVFNIKDFGAVGDGKTDDTAAINRAIADGGRCGPDCGTSTTVPAVVYFPSGKYLVSSPIIQYYNTQFLGDVSCTMRISLRPTI